MLKYLFSIIAILISNYIICQNNDSVYIRILGKYSYTSSTDSNIIFFSFIDDINKCDPKIGYIPINEKIKHFKESLKTNSINPKRLVEFKKNFTNNLLFYGFDGIPNNEKVFYLYSTSDLELINISRICVEQSVKVIFMNRKIKDKHLEDEYIYAANALENALQNANKYSKILNLPKISIVNIDDETGEFYSSYYISNNEIFNLFNSNQSSYGLFVTFLLEKN